MDLSLLSLFNPSTINYHDQPRCTTKTISPADVSCALSFMELLEPHYHFALAKYCHDNTSFNLIWDYYSNRIQQDILDNGWEDQPSRARHLALIPLYEAIFAKPCKLCEGKGYISTHSTEETMQHNIIVCERCRSTGVTSITVREQQKVTGISKSAWSRTWRKRIDIYLKEIQSTETEIGCRLKKQFYPLS